MNSNPYFLERLSIPVSLNLRIPQIRLHLSDFILSKLLLRVGGADGWGNDDVLADFPVYGGCDALFVAGLEGVDDAEDFGCVAACGGGVHLLREEEGC